MRPFLRLLPILMMFGSLPVAAAEIDFNRDIRPILSNKCFACHGPDEGKLEAGLRLDHRDVATRPLQSGNTAVVPGEPAMSELLNRITADDADLRMPPAEFGKQLTPAEVDLLQQWIRQGAEYAVHWSYVRPVRPEIPVALDPHAGWPRNPIDHFVLSRIVRQGMTPSAEADSRTLGRRVFLDLTGLPPTPEEIEAFVADRDPLAYERLVDDLLRRPAFGEHWARQWLDLARYADSAGYADDPSRTIWAYRDWVIRSLNSNMPFDQFTIQQIAGDLLPNASDDQLIATAFHRNTLTNNEGGTQDEEFRNVAVVDRVNTTMAVWMGTTIACAQCHSHKYDPISQEEYFRFFSILNNTQDADRRDESPVLELFTDEQRELKGRLTTQIAELRAHIAAPNETVTAAQKEWEVRLHRQPHWVEQHPVAVQRASGQSVTISEDGAIFIEDAAETDVCVVDLPLPDSNADRQTAMTGVAAIRLQTIPDSALPGGGSGHGGGNFVITELKAQLVPTEARSPAARFVRIEIPGKQKILSLAEVQVFSLGENSALTGAATQSSTDYDGPAALAIDGQTDGDFQKKSVTHTAVSDDPWWELDLTSQRPIDSVRIWNRTDNRLQARLADFCLKLLDEQRQVVWQQVVSAAPDPSIELIPTGIRDLPLLAAYADYHQPEFAPQQILDGRTEGSKGWAIGGRTTEPHSLIVVPQQEIRTEFPAVLRLIIEQKSPYKNHLLGRFRLSITADGTAIERARLPPLILAILDQPAADRDDSRQQNLDAYYRDHVAPEFAMQREQLADAERQLAAMKPATSVPVLRELNENRRVTRLQYRGNYLDLGPEVTSGVPSVFHPLPADSSADRLSLAKWLVDPENPLTARVLANRCWESLFGRGIVVTSEEFGAQGELPTHPELLDWMAVELMQTGWDTRALLRLIVTSATYRQSSRVTTEVLSRDRDNRWLARGPRVRLSAEMVRDQVLFVSGLLSRRMYGEPVKPLQPNLGLTAAFGSSTDWKTSEGSDRYRRGIYTTWRRSNPYPSMATFDAPNREVCTVRRNQTNTPLQSLVTLNDPVYVEAAQSLARLAMQQHKSPPDQLRFVFHRSLLRSPELNELESLMALYQDALHRMQEHPDQANRLATEPLGALPEGIDSIPAAALTVVCNVVLNLDEMFLKP